MDYSKRSSVAFFSVVISALAVWIYFPGIYSEPIWDDAIFISENPLYLQDNYAKKVFTEPFELLELYYRPVALLTIYWQAKHFDVWALHAANIALHVFNILLISMAGYLFLKQNRASASDNSLLGRLAIPLSAALYALHPAMVESVGWIVGRFDLLMTTFLLLSVNALLLIPSATVALCFCFIFVFIAALCKEMVLVSTLAFPMIYLFARLLSGEVGGGYWSELKAFFRSRYFAASVTASVAIAGSYLLKNHNLGYIYKEFVAYGVDFGGPLERMLLVFRTIGGYLALLFAPYSSTSPLHYEAIPLRIDNLKAWLGFGAALVILLSALFARPRWLKLTSVAVLCYLLLLLPVLNLKPVPTADSIYADRFITFPLAFFCTIFAPSLISFWVGQRISLMLVPLLLVTLMANGLFTKVTVQLWTTNAAFWEWTHRRVPESALASLSLGLVKFEAGQLQEAKGLYEESLSRMKRAVTLMNYGLILEELKEYDKAEAAFLEALEYPVRKTEYYSMLPRLAVILLKQNKLDDVPPLLASSERELPNHHLIAFAWVRYYLMKNDVEEAKRQADLCLKNTPELIRPRLKVMLNKTFLEFEINFPEI